MGAISLAALTSHPIQYQAPLFREIASRPNIDLTVYFGSRQGYEETHDAGFGRDVEWDVPLVEGYDHVFLEEAIPLRSGSGPLLFNPAIARRVADHDAIWVHGYGSLTAWTAYAAAAYHGVPTVLRGEGTPPEDRHVATRAKRAALAALFDRVDAFACIGTRNRQFYREFGIEEMRLFDAPYTVDNAFFRERRRELPDCGTLRSEVDISQGRPVVLFVGKLIERKRPGLLLEAFLDATNPGDATLLFVGDGEQRHALEARARERDREGDVRFAGFVNQSQLPRYYELSDTFCLPSAEENWGLVINEAMNFGLPVVATRAVGSTEDLVDDGTGRVVPTDDRRALADAVRDAVENSDEWRRRGEHACERIDEWGISETADGLCEAVQFVAE